MRGKRGGRRGRRIRAAMVLSVMAAISRRAVMATTIRCGKPALQRHWRATCRAVERVIPDPMAPDQPIRAPIRRPGPARPAAVERASIGWSWSALGITWILDGLEVTLAGSVAAALQTSPRAPSHRRAGRPDRQRLSGRRGARGRCSSAISPIGWAARSCSTSRSASISWPPRATAFSWDFWSFLLLPLPHRRGHRRRVLGHQLGDPGADPGAPARPHRPRHQRQLLGRRGGRRAALGVAARSRPCSAPTWAGGSPSAAAPCSAW